MQFTERKRRQNPTVIIISLIDVLIVVLIFLIVTTTFKQQPAVALSLPESNQAKPGTSPNALDVTISKQGVIYLKKDPVTLEKLQSDLTDAARANPEISLVIRADKEAPWGKVLGVFGAARAAGITKTVSDVQVPGAQAH
jgi:biopolymer transport protein ExbD